MFDRTFIQAPSAIRVETLITEKRAPTDESVRLLREMEDKAKAEVIKAVQVTDNQFHGVLHSMFDAMSYRNRLRMIYSINGKKLTTDYDIIDGSKTPDDWVPGLIDAVARDIALEILKKPLTDAIKANPSIQTGRNA
jgi:hypothetical protein